MVDTFIGICGFNVLRRIAKLFAILTVVYLCCIFLEIKILSPIVLYKMKHSKSINVYGTFVGESQTKYLSVSVEDELLCKFMEINPYKPAILKLSGLDKKTIECQSDTPDLTYIKGSRLEINQAKAKDVTSFKGCRYRDIIRHPESDHRVEFGNWSEYFISGIQLPGDTEFILAVCENNQSTVVSKQYHALVPRYEKIIELDLLKQKKRQVESSPKETLNVIMVGLDGVSRHQMMRGMNKTYTFLMEELHSFDLTMYTQVGINTFPNYLPLFSGYSLDEINQWWSISNHLDPLDTVWREYGNAGYRTLYTEDWPSLGAFHFSRQGFLFPPTTYYSHPICVAMEEDEELWKQDLHCAGKQPEVNFHLDYVNRFLDTFRDAPKFAVTFFTKLTHKDMTENKRVDDHIYNFYKNLQEKGHLNNTLLITFSDHGPRWGAIRATVHGILESRAPYAVLSFPKWFLDKYPDVAQNLRINSKRLTTHFDVHVTLRDLLYFKASGKIPLIPREHGISLFSEVPKNRTCPDIPIPMEFCLCNQETVEEVPINSSISNGLAGLVVGAINDKRNSSLCAGLKLRAILQTFAIKLPSLGSDDKRLYKVKFQTVPGNAVYEGTVQTKACTDKELIGYFDQLKSGNTSNPLKVTVGASIDRFTLYKGQADCEPDASKKPYCYCLHLIK
ncbi:hypothetical protein Btru_047960 [Bulinus truncatus]|nr:hypothetical protein Btru_047960 [Bulinus truncatus]